MHADKLLRFKAPVMPANQVTALGGVAIHVMRERVRAGKNVFDQPAKPYSDKPVYIPLTNSKGRTKTALGGREILTAKDILAMKRAGTAEFTHKGKKQNSAPGGVGARITKSRKTVKFANRSEYKRAKGKPGHRDLEESGRMLNDIGIVAQNASSLHIGFRREEEHRKAQGNQAIDPWYGLSPGNRVDVIKKADEILAALKDDVIDKTG